MSGNVPEHRVRLPLIRQSWRQVAFLHWRVDADEIARRLPDGLEPDLVDGSAWIGLTLFRVERFRVLGLPPVPVVSSFAETNLRTYVRHHDGRDGIWFLSLDVSSTANAVAGRLLVPYHRSRMSVTDDGAVAYRCRRLGRPPAHHDITVVPGDPIAATDVSATAASLVGRWRAFARRGPVLLEVPVDHEPWPLREAELDDLDETIIAAAGLPTPVEAPMVHVSPGADARLGPPRPC